MPTAISGQGFIAIAAVIFGKWTPHGGYLACLLFGFAQALTVVLGGGNFAVPSEILAMLPYVLTDVLPHPRQTAYLTTRAPGCE